MDEIGRIYNDINFYPGNDMDKIGRYREYLTMERNKRRSEDIDNIFIV